LDEHVHDLQAVARDERESGPVVVLGHSYGGIVALAAAADSPELFDLVIVYETPLPWVYRRAGSHPPLGDNPALEAEMFFRRVVSDAAWERLSLAEKENRRLDGDALLDDLRVLRGPTPFDVTTVVSPLVYAYGDDERGDYYVELVRALGALVPGLRSQRLPGAGHGAHLASPDQLAAVIKKSWEDQCESE
jgi:pimeloyl-ACP methyl ester carboxylesterase